VPHPSRTKKTAILTEAVHGIIVSSAAEKSALNSPYAYFWFLEATTTRKH
jgi:hypothetical protein